MKTILEQFIPKFFGLLRTHEIYPVENETSIKAREDFLYILKEVLKEESSNELIIETYSEHFLINNKLIKPESSNVIVFTRLNLRLKKLQIARIKISQDLEKEELLSFLSSYVKLMQGEKTIDEFKGEIFPSIKIWEKENLEDYEEKKYIANLLNFIDVFSKFIIFHKHTFEQIKKGIPIDFLHIRRAVEDFICSLEEIQDKALGFLSIGLNEREEWLHSVLRAIIIERFASFLKMPLKLIEDLIFVSLFSNIGMELLPKEIYIKEIKEEEKEDFLKEISAKSYEFLLNLKPITHSTSLVINLSLSFSEKKRNESTFYEILKVIKAYESLIQNKPYRLCYHPLKAIEIMWKEREKNFDKKILELFFSFLTKEPVGSTWLSKNDNQIIVFSKNEYKTYKEGKWNFSQEKPEKPLPIYNIKINPILAFLGEI